MSAKTKGKRTLSNMENSSNSNTPTTPVKRPTSSLSAMFGRPETSVVSPEANDARKDLIGYVVKTEQFPEFHGLPVALILFGSATYYMRDWFKGEVGFNGTDQSTLSNKGFFWSKDNYRKSLIKNGLPSDYLPAELDDILQIRLGPTRNYEQKFWIFVANGDNDEGILESGEEIQSIVETLTEHDGNMYKDFTLYVTLRERTLNDPESLKLLKYFLRNY